MKSNEAGQEVKEAQERKDAKDSNELGAAAGADAGAASPPPGEGPRRRRGSMLLAIGKFISTNSSFFSSFVIGLAGIVATSTYQCNQSKLAERQADLQARMAREQADNTWKVERAKILSQNLQTLTARGGDTVEQRYGVLLSLSRGQILDPDVSMSYALELGRDNPEYMRSVLTNIEHKDEAYYRRLLAAYWVTCTNRYGVRSPGVDACKQDILDPRSNALEQVVADDLEGIAATEKLDGPMVLLRDDREVHANLLKLVGLFDEFLQDVFERRQWLAIQRFLDYSHGSRLVGSLLLAVQIGASMNNTEREEVEHVKFKLLSATLKKYFETFLIGPDCDSDCRARIVGIMLTNLGKGQGQFVPALRLLLGRPRIEAEAVIARLNTRLTWCQTDSDDQLVLRDKVVLPVLSEQLQQPKPDSATVEDLVGLIALIPEPTTPTVLWKSTLEALAKFTSGRYPKQLAERRAAVQQLRLDAEPVKGDKKPPPLATKRHANFCHGAVQDRDDAEDE
ncbi:MAG TPA: hypothetical protein PLW65_20010 [Pseudomonadota bacterium]|nr:hypothetical protein [Pseudomonadota bacterium]